MRASESPALRIVEPFNNWRSRYGGMDSEGEGHTTADVTGQVAVPRAHRILAAVATPLRLATLGSKR